MMGNAALKLLRACHATAIGLQHHVDVAAGSVTGDKKRNEDFVV
jgi:hypothetical protein